MSKLIIKNGIKKGTPRLGMSPVEAARMLNISQSCLYTLLQKGQLHSRRVNGLRVISRSAVVEYKSRKHSSLDNWL